VIVLGFAAPLAPVPDPFMHDITVVALCLSSGFFFCRTCDRPIWSVPMDIAPNIPGRERPDEYRSAFAAIVSPLVAGYVIDLTGNWYLPS